MAGRCAGCARPEASPKTIASAERAIDTKRPTDVIDAAIIDAGEGEPKKRC
jgi:hypothetical protein